MAPWTKKQGTLFCRKTNNEISVPKLVPQVTLEEGVLNFLPLMSISLPS